jgi:RNA polymerase sigma factor for flagellar operon FliA
VPYDAQDAALAPALWSAFAAERDADARNRVIEHYLPLARMIAATLFARRGAVVVEFMDYMQLATLGLIESVDRFDAQRGVPFEAYAAPRIRGSVLNALEALSETYEQSELRGRLRQDRLESLHRGWAAGKADLFGELADIAVGFALGYMLEGSGLVSPDEAHDGYRQDFYRGVEQRQLGESLARLVAALPHQERRVVRYHYYQGLEFQEIARLFGVTKGRVSQIHRQALQLIREARDAPLGATVSYAARICAASRVRPACSSASASIADCTCCARSRNAGSLTSPWPNSASSTDSTNSAVTLSR